MSRAVGGEGGEGATSSVNFTQFAEFMLTLFHAVFDLIDVGNNDMIDGDELRCAVRTVSNTGVSAVAKQAARARASARFRCLNAMHSCCVSATRCRRPHFGNLSLWLRYSILSTQKYRTSSTRLAPCAYA